MKKKLVSLGLCCVMTLSLSPTLAFASNQVDDFVAINDTIAVDALGSEKFENYDFTLDEIDEYIRTLPTVSDGESTISRLDIENSIQQKFSEEMQSYSSVTFSAFYSDSVELANVLSAYDGVSTANLATIMYHGNLAQSDAENRIFDDAYRHSTWNFRATKVLGASTVRTYTINYEWANQLVDTWKNYYNERYNYYFSKYYAFIVSGAMDVSSILLMASADADDYICEYKRVLQNSCRNSYTTFTQTFNNDNIMDWWNNKIGRDYGTNYPSYAPITMYTSALNNDELILLASDVTTSNYYYLWKYTNWWYTGT